MTGPSAAIRHVRVGPGGRSTFDVFIHDEVGARHLRGTLTAIDDAETRALSAALAAGFPGALYGAGATKAEGAAIDEEFGY